MSNKKLFWIAFFILSCCEFGQLAYSKNVSANHQANNPSVTNLQFHNTEIDDGNSVFKGGSVHYLLPR